MCTDNVNLVIEHHLKECLVVDQEKLAHTHDTFDFLVHIQAYNHRLLCNANGVN